MVFVAGVVEAARAEMRRSGWEARCIFVERLLINVTEEGDSWVNMDFDLHCAGEC